MAVNFGEGDLGTIITTTDGSFRYQIKWDDMLWMIRMVYGEAGGHPSDNTAAVLWCYAINRFYAQRGAFNRPNSSPPKALADCVQASSQAINPKWKRDGVFCTIGSSQYKGDQGGDPCNSSKLDHRDAISNMDWSDFSSQLQDFVHSFACGRIPNNVERAIDFATPRVAAHAQQNGVNITGQAALDARGYQLVWYSEGAFDITSNVGNAFFSSRDSRNWPDGFLKINFQGQNTTETTPPGASQPVSNPSAPQPSVDQGLPPLPPETIERIEMMTHGRQIPPSIKYNYYVLSDSGSLDPQVQGGNTIDPHDNAIESIYDRFYNQMMALKDVSNLDMTKTVPIIEIKTLDGDQTVNLTELIFSKNVKYSDISNNLPGINPELPLASVQELDITVQSPGTGLYAMSMGTLKIKIHNASAVRDDHPVGKYLSYMMRQGYHLRIRYGIQSPDRNVTQQSAFRTIEEDFMVAQHVITVQQEDTADCTFTLIPQATKLFNQLLVGESVPIGEIGPISRIDLKNAIESSIGDDVSQAQKNQIVLELVGFTTRFNSDRETPGFNLVQNDDNTIGSVIQGAIRQTDIIARQSTIAPIVVENTVNALKTLQAFLLSKRYEKLIDNNAYTTPIKGVNITAVNIGPLIFTMVKPEIDHIVSAMAQNQGFVIGQVDSFDDVTETNTNNSRTNVKFIFGNFNETAADWSGKPISSFPINVESIFAQLREQRDVGRYGDTVSNFISYVSRAIAEENNYTIPHETIAGRTVPRLEVPDIKFAFYPDHADSSSWIFYIYDAKERSVRLRNLLMVTRNHNPQVVLTEDQIIQACIANKVPWIKMGETSSLIRSMTAETSADDLISTANIINASQVHTRPLDGSTIPNGISQDVFRQGISQGAQQSIIQTTKQFLPIKLELDHWMVTSALLFYPIYVFFPIPDYSHIYVPQSLGQQVQSANGSTKMDLIVQVASENYHA